MLTTAQAFALAEQRFREGHPAQAEDLCRQVLQADHRHAGALHLLGFLCHQTGRAAQAVE
jgi:cytochrome c-type biogenesis protein CcmH/NrfG